MRVVVYASASSETPASFLEQAGELGKLLAQGRHVCVNGGGNLGGMGALNSACTEHGGKLVCVIHERWVIDGEDFEHSSVESIVVDGPDLAERKRRLLLGADAIVALPGGLGTLDELFEAACLKQIGMSTTDIPICLVNVNGYYDPLLEMLREAKANKLLFKAPESVLHSEPTAAKALQWCLKAQAHRVNVSKDLLGAAEAKTATSADSKKSPFKVLKALAMLPIIILCYTVLFYKTVDGLMGLGGEPEREEGGPTLRTLAPLRWCGEFFGLVALLLFACKNLK